VGDLEMEIEVLKMDNELLKSTNVVLETEASNLKEDNHKMKAIIDRLIENYGVETVKQMVGKIQFTQQKNIEKKE
jgi:hypothetical protein